MNLSIVNAITAVDLPNGISVLLIVHETIYNDTANHSLYNPLSDETPSQNSISNAKE
jgi:hypothetical protein